MAAAVVMALVAPVVAETDPALDVTAPAAAVSVGDRVPVRVMARGGDGWHWGELTVQAPELGPWEVVDGPRAVAGARPPVWELVLAPMAVGEQELPELAATVRPPDGEPRVVLPLKKPPVTVASVLPPDQEVEPAPLRDPVGVHGFPWEWVVPVTIALLPLMAVAAWWFRRRRETAADDPSSRIPPIDQLQGLLDELASRVGREPAEGVCDQLAAGFRRYLERRSGEPAQEMTSFELRGLARHCRWPEPVQRSLHRVMGVVDEVRFAQQRVADTALRQVIDTALEAGHGLEGFLTEQERPREVSG
jgi:hypothetical protein